MDDPLVSVAGLHALAYCERLFYLEEVERIRIADAAVFAGRALHAQIAAEEDESAVSRLTLESERHGLRGSVDVLRRRNGQVIPYEHKRGRSAGVAGAREPWPSDRLQVGAYALLVEDALGTPIPEARIRYHADGVTVHVVVDDVLRADVRNSVNRARALRESMNRPPVTENERLCVRCSLAPVCLPEEARLARGESKTPVRLFPPHPDRQALHVMEQGARVGRKGEELSIEARDRSVSTVPIAEVGQVVLHGFAQISTQAIRLCTERDVGVHWITQGGTLVGSLAPSGTTAQRHLRQFQALSDPDLSLSLARRLVAARLEGQLRYLLRATRGSPRPAGVIAAITSIRSMLRRVPRVESAATLLGVEGNGAAAYFGGLPELLSPQLDERLRFQGRSRRPPQDRMNALLSYGYGMLYRDVLQGILAVGLHPGVGFYHRPRSAAQPLALDVMELFRVALVDMAIVAALNRSTFHVEDDFHDVPGQVLLSDSGRRKMIDVIERRKTDTWRHSVVGYSLSYARMMELEVRLLEKEWMGEGGLFARFRLR